MQREVYPYIVYHILPLCTSAFWRFGNPACMIFILFKSFRFARAKQIHICVSSVPRTIVYPRNVHLLFGILYRFTVFFLISHFHFPRRRIPQFLRAYSNTAAPSVSSYISCAYFFTPSPLTTAKIPRGYAHFSATSTGGFSHFGAITPLRPRCVRRNNRGGSGRGVRRPTRSAATV